NRAGEVTGPVDRSRSDPLLCDVLDAVEASVEHGDDIRRKRRVVERGGVFFPVVQRPANEVDQLLALDRVSLIDRNEQERERRDWVRALACRIDDRNTKVRGRREL